MLPQNFPFPHSGNIQLFDYFASATIVNGTSGTVVTATMAERFSTAWITLFGHGIDDPVAFELSVWRILVNNHAVRFYDNIRDQLGAFREPMPIAPIPFGPLATISVVVENNTAAPRLYAARLQGFFDYGGK